MTRGGVILRVAAIACGVASICLLQWEITQRRAPAEAPDEADEFMKRCYTDEWLLRLGSFVAGRPDLSGQDPELAREYRGHIGRVFAPSGVDVERVAGLHWAVGSHAGVLVRCRLSTAQLTRFLAGKPQLRESTCRLLSSVYATGEVEFQVPGTDTRFCLGTLKVLGQYPFTRLAWWPVPLGDAEGMVPYLGWATWDFRETHAGAPYLVFARGDGLVYVVSP